MNKYIFRLVLISLSIAITFAACAPTDATFPSKSINIVVPWKAGGGTDALARSLAQEASKVFGVAVNVINRTGGSGTVGHTYGMKARPDGYTVTMITYELCSYKPLGRAPIDDTDFKALMQLNQDPAAITIKADSEWKTLDDFLKYAKAHPKQITIGNSGPGAVWHLGAVKLEKLTGTKFTHIPHEGASPAVTQLAGGHLSAVAVSPAEVLQFVQSGDLRCLAVMSDERFANLANVPTFKELGLDLVHATWRGLAVPKDTPEPIVNQLEEGFKKAFDAPAFQETAQKMMLGLHYRNSEDFAAFLRSESQSIAELIEGLDL